MYIIMCLYITITILLWVLLIYPFIKHYTVVISIITIQFSHTNVAKCSSRRNVMRGSQTGSLFKFGNTIKFLSLL